MPSQRYPGLRSWACSERRPAQTASVSGEPGGAHISEGVYLQLAGALEVGEAFPVRGNDRNRVGRGHEKPLAQDHVAVTIAIRSGTELGCALGIRQPDFHGARQVGRVGEVWVRVNATKVLEWFRPDD